MLYNNREIPILYGRLYQTFIAYDGVALPRGCFLIIYTKRRWVRSSGTFTSPWTEPTQSPLTKPIFKIDTSWESNLFNLFNETSTLNVTHPERHGLQWPTTLHKILQFNSCQNIWFHYFYEFFVKKYSYDNRASTNFSAQRFNLICCRLPDIRVNDASFPQATNPPRSRAKLKITSRYINS